MELALATYKAKAHSALAGALRQLLLLIALAYAIGYIVPACLSFDSTELKQQPRSRTLVQGSSFDLHAELVCETASRRLWEHSPCNFPK
jgi:hypothetical protein